MTLKYLDLPTVIWHTKCTTKGVTKFNFTLGDITMAITKKSLISNSPASKSKSKSNVKVASPAAAAKLATASKIYTAKPASTARPVLAKSMNTASATMRTTLRTTLKATRATYAKLTSARIVS